MLSHYENSFYFLDSLTALHFFVLIFDLTILFLPPPSIKLSIKLQYSVLIGTVISPFFTTVSAFISKTHDFSEFFHLLECFGDSTFSKEVVQGVEKESEGTKKIDVLAKPGGILILGIALLATFYRFLKLTKEYENIRSKVQEQRKNRRLRKKERAAKYLDKTSEMKNNFDRNDGDDSILFDLKKRSQIKRSESLKTLD